MTERELELIQKNNSQEIFYAQRVNQLIREKYPQSAVEAILNNYLEDPNNEKHKAEFLALQRFRLECKNKAKIELHIT